LSALDNLMLDGELPNLPMHMSAITLYDTQGKRGGDRLRAELEARFEAIAKEHFPILRCKVKRLPLHLDRSYWVDDDRFSLSHHVSHVALPKPRDWPALYRLFGEFHARPLDSTRPLWEVMFVEGLDKLDDVPRGATAVFIKIHHSVFDGKGALRLFSSLHNVEPGGPMLAAAPGAGEDPTDDFSSPSMLTRYARAWWHNIERPFDLAGTLLKLAPQLFRGTSGSEHAPVPDCHFNREVAADRVIGHISMDMRALRKLEKKYHCTINDIAMCVIGGALRSFLLEEAELPRDSLQSLMPISTRRRDETGSIGNHVSVARVALRTDVPDAHERLQKIHKETTKGKQESGKGSSRALLEIVDEIHPALILWLGDWLVSSGRINTLAPTINTVVTNVPGAQQQLFLGDAPQIDYLGFGPLAPNTGLFHTVSSTPDKVSISFLSTAELVGNGTTYKECLANSWGELNPA
ncbi:MAG: DUF1298 domain-containing protein, partial [Halioglobus sp.]|nr:DUF1298 domain-containing protein [Halioglobus sp.]